MIAIVPYILLAVVFLAIAGAIFFQRQSAKLAGLDLAEQYIREQTALYRHYCIPEVQRAVAVGVGVRLSDAQAIELVQQIRDEFGMGPIASYNLPGYQGEDDTGSMSPSLNIDELPQPIVATGLQLLDDDSLLNEIQQMAAQLDIGYHHGPSWFDLDTNEGALFALHGTYEYTSAGFAVAYGDLVRYQERTSQQSS